MIKGFCNSGPLSSARVKELIQPVSRLIEQSWENEVRNIVVSQDTHSPNAIEFKSWPPHCIKGTGEAETIDEFTRLPFFKDIVIIEKNSLASDLNDELVTWLKAHPSIDTCIVAGNCTDLCVYQMAMFLRLDANERQLNRRVIVPVGCVNTYHLSVSEAAKTGAMPHPGDFTQAYFLYHMALNGIEICRSIT
jgi:nicotinamidase-related amidase